jgi:Transcriptional regulator of a riboflavin/FAD biosynthetic operon
LKIHEEDRAKLKSQNRKHRVDGFTHNDNDYGGLDLYKIRVEGQEAAFLDIDRTDHENEVAEIIAPEELRSTLSIEDGDMVEIDE